LYSIGKPHNDTILQTTALNYKLIKKIKDERFDEELIDQYDLLIHVGQRDLQIGVIHAAEQRVVFLEDYVFPAVPAREDHTQWLDQLFDGHPFLKAAFWKNVKVCIKNSKFIQVPDALFLKSAETEYLKFNALVEDDEEVISVVNKQAGAVTVFAVDKELKQWLTKLYPNSTVLFMHQSSSMIEGVTQFAQNKKESPLYIYVDRFKLHIISCKGGKLIYYNQFIIKQFSDYVKYIMLVMKSLNLNQATSQVVLWGYIGKNSPHYHEFYRYINNVVFGSRPKYLTFGYMFDEVQDHHFFDLYSMYLIG
jgi:hypothetical protein